MWQPNPGGASAGGKWVRVGDAPMTPAERQAADAAAPTQTVATREVGGRVYTVVTIVPKPGQPGQPGQIVLGPDGQQVAGGIPGEPPKRTPVTRNGKTYFQVQGADGSIYFEDQSGTKVPLPDDGSTTPDPTGAPPPSFQIGDAAEDLRKYDEWLAQQIGTGPGKISVARADQLREQRRKMWQVALDEKQGVVNAQSTEAGRQTTERGQTLQDQGNRRTSATGIANQASGDFMPLATKLGAGGGGADLMQAIADARINAQDFVTMSGANRVVAPVTPGPALAAVNAMPLNPRATGPNALGLGQGGTIFRPQSVAPPPVAPAAPTGPPPTAGEAGGPPLAPGPVAPTPPAAPPPAAVALAASPQGTSKPMVRVDLGNEYVYYDPTPDLLNAPGVALVDVPRDRPNAYREPKASAPAVNLKPDVPAAAPTPAPTNNAPFQDEQRGPGYGATIEISPTVEQATPGAGATELPNPPLNTLPQGLAPSAPPGFLSAMRPGSQPAYDPTPSAQAMIADPSWDNEAVKQAYRELYGRDLQVA